MKTLSIGRHTVLPTRVDELPMEVTGFLEEVGGIRGRSVSNVGGGRNGGRTGFKVASWMEEWGGLMPCSMQHNTCNSIAVCRVKGYYNFLHIVS